MSHKHFKESNRHPKQDFQVERLAFFSDAVFAIAITLLILEFKVPHLTGDSTLESIWEQLFDLRFHFISLLLSYTLISIFWLRHHFLFKHINDYNREILVANLFLLLPIVFFPFSTSFLSESIHAHLAYVGYRLFSLNVIFASGAMYILYWLALEKYKEFSFELNPEERLNFKSKTLYLVITFVIIFLSTFFNNDDIVIYTIPVVIVGQRFFVSLSKRKLKQSEAKK